MTYYNNFSSSKFEEQIKQLYSDKLSIEEIENFTAISEKIKDDFHKENKNKKIITPSILYIAALFFEAIYKINTYKTVFDISRDFRSPEVTISRGIKKINTELGYWTKNDSRGRKPILEKSKIEEFKEYLKNYNFSY